MVHYVEMERFSSVEVAKLILMKRNRTKQSSTHYVVDRQRSANACRGYFPDTDKTGHMRVFLRGDDDPVPGLLDTPDEEWIVERGGRSAPDVVIRLAWAEGDEKVERVHYNGWESLTIIPARYIPPRPDVPDPDYEVRKPTQVAPVAAVCEGCRQIPSVTGRCGCS
jgi:hypothetical protein